MRNLTISSGLLVSVLIFQQIIGSLAFPVSKYGLGFIEPFTFAFFRFVLSSVLLTLIVKVRTYDRAIESRDRWRLFGLGVLIIPLNQTLYLWGQSMTAAGHGALLFATVPLWIFILALVHLKEKPIWRRVVGVVVAMSGVVTIMAAGAIEIGKEYLFGDLIILVAVVAWAYYTVLGKPLVEKYGAFRTTAWALVSGSILYFPFGLYRAFVFDYSGATIGGWLSVVYMAVGTSIIAYVLWYWVLKHMEASRIAVFHNIQPVIASAVAYIFLNEPLGWPFVIGGVIALTGVIIAEV